MTTTKKIIVTILIIMGIVLIPFMFVSTLIGLLFTSWNLIPYLFLLMPLALIGGIVAAIYFITKKK